MNLGLWLHKTLLVKYSSRFIYLTINFDGLDENCFAMVSYDATYIWGSRAQLREGFPMAAHMNGRGLALRVGVRWKYELYRVGCSSTIIQLLSQVG